MSAVSGVLGFAAVAVGFAAQLLLSGLQPVRVLGLAVPLTSGVAVAAHRRAGDHQLPGHEGGGAHQR